MLGGAAAKDRAGAVSALRVAGLNGRTLGGLSIQQEHCLTCLLVRSPHLLFMQVGCAAGGQAGCMRWQYAWHGAISDQPPASPPHSAGAMSRTATLAGRGVERAALSAAGAEAAEQTEGWPAVNKQTHASVATQTLSALARHPACIDLKLPCLSVPGFTRRSCALLRIALC